MSFFSFSFGGGCTTIGIPDSSQRNAMDFGQIAEMKVCTILETGVSEEDMNELFDHWNDELELYTLKAVPYVYGKMDRPGFMGQSILTYLYNLKLEPGCDRILYLKGRTWGDIVFEFFTLGIFAGIGIKLEIQGAVDSETHSRGYIKSKYISTLQLLFSSPKSTLVHEGYHLLGCGHQLFMEECYVTIRNLKNLAKDQNTEQGFFPTLTSRGQKFQTRRKVDSQM
ncbi:hypothetical protein EHS15_12485 [Leptospira idonii]|uniref:Uncharacterized protein n=1 Tax=Leptospira idonii TaxID=1193500 RepID=A0A4R9M0N0_9LEPT|nr:hypothetical protein EHS15_12485 [Leptospira idonii]